MADMKTCTTCGGLFLDIDEVERLGTRWSSFLAPRTLGIFPVSIVEPPPTRPMPTDVERKPITISNERNEFSICFCNSPEDLEPSPDADR